jgi:hypothetical protein
MAGFFASMFLSWRIAGMLFVVRVPRPVQLEKVVGKEQEKHRVAADDDENHAAAPSGFSGINKRWT